MFPEPAGLPACARYQIQIELMETTGHRGHGVLTANDLPPCPAALPGLSRMGEHIADYPDQPVSIPASGIIPCAAKHLFVVAGVKTGDRQAEFRARTYSLRLKKSAYPPET